MIDASTTRRGRAAQSPRAARRVRPSSDAAFVAAAPPAGPARALHAALSCALALVLGAALVPAGGLPQAFADDSANTVGATFVVDDIEYTILAAADSPGSDTPGTVSLTDGTVSTATDLAVGVVSQTDGDGDVYYYTVVAVGSKAFKGNTTLRSIAFTEDLVSASSSLAVGTYAFQNCTALESVEFPEKVAGIGTSAFQGCTALEEVAFPDGAELYVRTSYSSAAIGSNAFKGCTSLTSITIPAITSTTRFGDAYYTFDEYNPGSNQTIGVDSLDFLYVSAYQGFWHSGGAPTCRNGIDGTAFSGCTALEEVVFCAGASLGAYAYFYIGADAFEDCTALTSLVFESEQAYAIDPNGSMHNAIYSDFFDGLEQDITLYYAVDYYATQDEAQSDDDAGSGRIARVEYARGTSVADIQAGDAEALVDSLYDADAYAHEGYADGVVPDPNEAAVEAFGEAAADSEWVWKLTDSQSQREGLTDSCAAYLVAADDIAAGRVVTDVMSSLQKRSDQNYSRWIVDGAEQDSTFDAYRFYNDSSFNLTTADTSDDPADDLYLVVGSAGEEGLLSQLEVYAADGTPIDVDDCDVTMQRYDSDADELLDAEGVGEALEELSTDGEPVLVNISPQDGSGYTGTLQVWLLVKGNSGSVAQRFTASAAGSLGDAPTWYYATVKSETSGTGTKAYTGPYAVQVDAGDLSSALVACAFAGLAEAPINVSDSGEDSFGFYLGKKFSAYSGALTSTSSSDGLSFSAQGLGASEFAVACYEAFASTMSTGARSRLGVEEEDYPWGTTALLVDVNELESTAAAVAAYAYAAAAPVFYTEEDGSASDETLACLADFEAVVAIGGAEAFADGTLDGLDVVEDFVGEATNASELSRGMADYLMEEGLASASVVTVSDATDAFDAIGALNRSGHDGGITLVSGGSADSKLTSAYLRELRDDVDIVRLFGRTDSNLLTEGFDLYESLLTLWDERGGYEQPEVASGDTVELYGLGFSIGDGAGTQDDPFAVEYASTLWGSAVVCAGTYEVDGVYYLLSEDAEAQEEAEEDAGADEDAGEGDSGDSGDDADADAEDDEADASGSGASASSGASVSGSSSSSSSSGGSSASGTSASTGSSTLVGSSSSGGSSKGGGTSSSLKSSGGSASSAAGSGGDGAASKAASGTAADFVDNGWDVTNVGDVTEVEAADSIVSGVSVSIDDSLSDVVWSWALVVLSVLAAASLAGGLWFLLRRRNEGFDKVYEAC